MIPPAGLDGRKLATWITRYPPLPDGYLDLLVPLEKPSSEEIAIHEIDHLLSFEELIAINRQEQRKWKMRTPAYPQ